MDGILPLWKPKGFTSHDCVQKVRHIFQMRQVGHTGTLDPGVEGVLVLCLGRATKIVPFLTAVRKTYKAKCTLGIATETEDATGKIIEKEAVIQFPSEQEITRVLHSFQGEITQIPPMYSAVRVKGKRLYEYARNKEYVERPSRQVYIHDIELIQTFPTENTFKINVVCSEGTYIRTLCVDIGKELGYPAHMSNLVRTEASNFLANETVCFSQLEQAEENGTLSDLIHPLARGLRHLDYINVDEQTKYKVQHGQKLKRPRQKLQTNPFRIMYKNHVLAIYQIHPNNSQEIKPVRVFH